MLGNRILHHRISMTDQEDYILANTTALVNHTLRILIRFSTVSTRSQVLYIDRLDTCVMNEWTC
jgi:hypothetical protein